MKQKDLHYKAIIFDLGNVLIDVDFNKTFHSLASCSGKSIDFIKQSFSEDSAYEKHERNEISSQDYFAHINSKLDLNISFGDFVNSWNLMLGPPIAESMDFIQKYKKALTFLVLTNTNELHRKAWPSIYKDELSSIKTIFTSSQIKARKPEKESYSIVLQESGFKANEVIFVDDRIENITGAKKLGIKSLLFTQPQETIKKLEELLLNP